MEHHRIYLHTYIFIFYVCVSGFPLKPLRPRNKCTQLSRLTAAREVFLLMQDEHLMSFNTQESHVISKI